MIEYTELQYISRDDLYNAGYSKYKINQLVQKGQLIVANRSFFENPHYTGEINDFYCVPAYAKKGVVCLMSAAIYYGLSTSRPLQIDVALPRRSRIPHSPNWPEIQFYLFSDFRYSSGINTVKEGKNQFLIYNMEKTVCDILFYRNKLGFEPAIKILKKYLERPDRNINELMRYADNLRTGKLLKEYLEVIL